MPQSQEMNPTPWSEEKDRDRTRDSAECCIRTLRARTNDRFLKPRDSEKWLVTTNIIIVKPVKLVGY